MENTSHDLSHGESTLDLEDLIYTASTAFAAKREEIVQGIKKLYDLKTRDFVLESEWIRRNAIALVKSAETLYTLIESRKREITVRKRKEE